MAVTKLYHFARSIDNIFFCTSNYHWIPRDGEGLGFYEAEKVAKETRCSNRGAFFKIFLFYLIGIVLYLFSLCRSFRVCLLPTNQFAPLLSISQLLELPLKNDIYKYF